MKTFISLALIVISSFNVNSQDFYLAPNGVTCMCPNAAVGASGDPGNGIVYTKRTAAEITPQNAATTCTSGINDMNNLFWLESDFNENISSWDVSQVTNFYQFCLGCNVFNADISYWDVSSATNMGGMFAHCYVFNQDLSNWDVSNVTQMVGMFYEAFEFNQDISSWNVSSATYMLNMFRYAESFDHDLSNWSFNPDVTLPYFLSYSGFSLENYDLLLQSLLSQSITPTELGAHELKYCDVATRDLLINEGWTILGDDLGTVELEAPLDTIIEADSTSCQASGFDLGIPSVYGCGTITITNNAPSSLPLGVTEVTWTATDNYGNSQQDTQNVEVVLTSDKADICYVTSDWNNPSKNRIWITSDPALSGQNVAYHEVFREAPSGVFENIGFINPPEESFLDTSSDNTTQAYRYKVQTIDVCGQELTPSEYHKSILLQSGIATDNSVNLAWNPYVGLEFSTYNIYRSVNGAAYELLTSVAASNITYNDTSANVINNFYKYFVSIDVTSCGTNPFQPLSLRSNQEYVNPNLVIKDNALLSKSIVLYPNPASELINISATEGIEVRSVILYSTLGQRIMNVEGANSIDISALPSGVYYMTIETDQGRVNKTVIRK